MIEFNDKIFNEEQPAIDQPHVSSSGDDEHKYWVEDGKSWYQYIHSDVIYRKRDDNYNGKSFKHRRCPFCNRITCMATLHWYNHMKKCAPKDFSMADIGELRWKKPNTSIRRNLTCKAFFLINFTGLMSEKEVSAKALSIRIKS